MQVVGREGGLGERRAACFDVVVKSGLPIVVGLDDRELTVELLRELQAVTGRERSGVSCFRRAGEV